MHRLCFPILCQYISDMEQWTLTNQVKPACPKCPKRTARLYGSPNEIQSSLSGIFRGVGRGNVPTSKDHINRTVHQVRRGRMVKIPHRRAVKLATKSNASSRQVGLKTEALRGTNGGKGASWMEAIWRRMEAMWRQMERFRFGGYE
jgi:hypothetical protein